MTRNCRGWSKSQLYTTGKILKSEDTRWLRLCKTHKYQSNKTGWVQFLRDIHKEPYQLGKKLVPRLMSMGKAGFPKNMDLPLCLTDRSMKLIPMDMRLVLTPMDMDMEGFAMSKKEQSLKDTKLVQRL